MSKNAVPNKLGPMTGITTTVPVEVLLAADLCPVDLNNRFITHPRPHDLLRKAEEQGMPRTLCAWIKGMYAWLLDHPEVETIVAVTQGDCSNTHALAELLSMAGRRIVKFEFPTSHRPEELQCQIEMLANELGADLEAAEIIRNQLRPIRDDLAKLDRLTWDGGYVAGHENHLWQVCSSDFDGDPVDFGNRLRQFLKEAEKRPARDDSPRLGLVGVPPIFSDIHQTVDEFGAAIVFNEVQRQFAMPHDGPGYNNLCEQYLAFTYPYDIFGRIRDIAAQIKLRSLDGLIHYTQTFCHRQIQDIALRKQLGVPILTLEGDATGPVDGRTRLRIEAFLEMLG